MNYMRFIYACSLFLGLILPAAPLKGMMQLVNPTEGLSLDEEQNSSSEAIETHLNQAQQKRKHAAKKAVSFSDAVQDVELSPELLNLEKEIFSIESEVANAIDGFIVNEASDVRLGLIGYKAAFFKDVQERLEGTKNRIAFAKDRNHPKLEALYSQSLDPALRVEKLYAMAQDAQKLSKKINNILEKRPSALVFDELVEVEAIARAKFSIKCNMLEGQCLHAACNPLVKKYGEHSLAVLEKSIADAKSRVYKGFAAEIARKKERAAKFHENQLLEYEAKKQAQNNQLQALSKVAIIARTAAVVGASMLVVTGYFLLRKYFHAQHA